MYRPSGLSPRLRGNARPVVAGQNEIGSIPALAGERRHSQKPAEIYRVYPRACGGTNDSRHQIVGGWGLSPRLRGNVKSQDSGIPEDGSIPALAGERWIDTERDERRWVYPRACGGTASRCLPRPHSTGLSPRLRGNGKSHENTDCRAGSIPALAGERPNRRCRNRNIRVYPRACGGTASPWRIRGMARGLSPRLRGNAEHVAFGPELQGSIPALAGERPWPGLAIPVEWVYPRACGGTGRVIPGAVRGQGLSPRLRGNALTSPLTRSLIRSIPALAGERPGLGEIRENTRVYPRACGGTTTPECLIAAVRGLSPRLRGNGILPERQEPQAGSIPALAGERSSSTIQPFLCAVYPRACGGTARV